MRYNTVVISANSGFPSIPIANFQDIIKTTVMITDDKVNEINCLSDDFAVFFRRKSKNIGINCRKRKKRPYNCYKVSLSFCSGSET